MNWAKMEYFLHTDDLYYVIRYRANGKFSVTPFGFRSKDGAISYIVAHELDATERKIEL